MTKEKIIQTKDAIQYSLTGGRGKRVHKDVPFFSQDGRKISMASSVRQCAGVKVCEYFPEEMKKPHTHVDEEGHQWAKNLAVQSEMEAQTNTSQVEVLYAKYKDEHCERPR